ncbi:MULTISPECIES: fumarylacetoacetate hydrolase family protein [unclassified Streptomyces]|uniref:fumarylacetoacetate hydrolase family protein n=1 Tax=unclassified Streptomyces TaxID=2593676 RepID=UPI00192601E9|nr:MULTISPECIES: fumarylacetoacetate hydrolase family protein [unclassified Streptomyces]
MGVDPDKDRQRVTICTWLNGRLVQDGSIGTMIFNVAELVAYCSTFFTLALGDLILTGAPAGCDVSQTPKVALHPGDVPKSR